MFLLGFMRLNLVLGMDLDLHNIMLPIEGFSIIMTYWSLIALKLPSSFLNTSGMKGTVPIRHSSGETTELRISPNAN